LRLSHDDTADSVAVTARLNSAHPTALSFIVAASAAVVLTALRVFGVTGSGVPGGLAIGVLLYLLCDVFWLSKIAITAVVADGTVTIERRRGNEVRSSQVIVRTADGSFVVCPQPLLYGIAIHPLRSLSYDGHRIRLPFLFAIANAGTLMEEWNRLLAGRSMAESSA